MNSPTGPNPQTLNDLRKRNPGLATKTYHFIAPNPSYKAVNAEALKRIEKVTLEQLEEIDLSGLDLTTLPNELFELKNLRAIDLSRNKLASIPSEIQQLKDLNILIANENPITTVHKDIDELQNLVTLSLVNCQLPEFPEGILAIKSLRSLQLEGNKISEIPLGLKDMEIEEINLLGNPIRNLPEEFFTTTSARLFHYFNDREENPDTRNFTA